MRDELQRLGLLDDPSFVHETEAERQQEAAEPEATVPGINEITAQELAPQSRPEKKVVDYVSHASHAEEEF